jgi:hypothetical protein
MLMAQQLVSMQDIPVIKRGGAEWLIILAVMFGHTGAAVLQRGDNQNNRVRHPPVLSVCNIPQSSTSPSSVCMSLGVCSAAGELYEGCL